MKLADLVEENFEEIRLGTKAEIATEIQSQVSILINVMDNARTKMLDVPLTIKLASNIKSNSKWIQNQLKTFMRASTFTNGNINAPLQDILAGINDTSSHMQMFMDRRKQTHPLVVYLTKVQSKIHLLDSRLRKLRKMLYDVYD